jgi:hypothetical protein
MNETSRTSAPPTLPATSAATSSPASGDGISLSSLPGGTDLFGRALAPASPSASPGKARASRTRATSGRSGFGSSASAVLQSSLESRLRQQFSMDGSILYRLTWKVRRTPSGRRIFLLQASERRSGDSACSSWPTAQSRDGAHSRSGQEERTGGRRRNLDDYVTLVGWPTAKGTDGQKGGGTSKNGQDLVTTALGAWPTATTRDWKSSASNKHGENARPLNEVARLTGWPTATARDATNARNRSAQRSNPESAHHDGLTLVDAVDLPVAGWTTASATDGERSGDGITEGMSGSSLTQQVRLGPISSGSPAETGKPGQLAPAFSLWLMGYPDAWALCAVLATRSCRRLRRPSSEPT